MPKILLLPLATAGFVLLEEAESWGWMEVPFAEVVHTVQTLWAKPIPR
jgi:hypothetical protein